MRTAMGLTKIFGSGIDLLYKYPIVDSGGEPVVPTNDEIILNHTLDQERQERFPALDAPAFFGIFAIEQALKNFDLSYDEIESGLVDGGDDGGIDGFYTFVNGELVQDDSNFSKLKNNVTIDVYVIQSKVKASFEEVAMNRLAITLGELFDLSKNLDKFTSVYNADVISAAKRFRKQYEALASKFPILRVTCLYITKGSEPHLKVKHKVDTIQNAVTSAFSNAEFNFEFIGASGLLDLARKAPNISNELKLAENPISPSGDVAFVCLVSLRDYYNFITDEIGHLRRQIFEANVRDYQGKTQVNQEIGETLSNPQSEEFWWLNNGITILASNATLSGKKLTIENPEIVNGLQTSREIFDYFHNGKSNAEHRNTLVRVIVPTAQESRDRIIRATNSQTAIPPASLRATDRIHRDIEQYLGPYGLYYDRRKNFYKNEGKPRSAIVSIPQLAQGMMAIVLARPDTARARPSSLLKDDDQYTTLFNEKYPIEIYRVCAEIMKVTDEFLASRQEPIPASGRNDLRFYVAMVVVREMLEKTDPSAQEIAGLVGTPPTSMQLEIGFEWVNEEYFALGGNDQVAKGPNLIKNIREYLQHKLG